MANLKMIMTRAWEIKKTDSRNIFGECLKMAWAESKNTKFYGIKTWFLNKNFTQGQAQVIKEAELGGELVVASETEKAVKFVASSDFGRITFWCPKSCLITEVEINRTNERMNAGLNYNMTLVVFAKENGIKGFNERLVRS